MQRERWDALTEEQQEEFAPLCPDFVYAIIGVEGLGQNEATLRVFAQQCVTSPTDQALDVVQGVAQVAN